MTKLIEPVRWIFMDMQVGEGFLAPTPKSGTIRALASYYKKKYGRVFKVIKQNDKYLLVERVI